MSGHSRWKTIKHKKETSDQKRGQVFSKLINAVSIAAKQEPNPQFNARLRAAIEKAKENKVPQENIERAIKRSSGEGNLEELIMEAYGPGGAAILIEAITDNKNRTISEIKKVLNDYQAKWAEPGSVRWAFEQISDRNGFVWQAKFKQEIDADAKQKLQTLIEGLENHVDVQEVRTNAQ